MRKEKGKRAPGGGSGVKIVSLAQKLLGHRGTSTALNKIPRVRFVP